MGTCGLRRYHEAHTEDGRDLDVGGLRAFCGGAPSKSVWGRLENAKFVHQQLATPRRLLSWGVEGHADDTCRACRQAPETVPHLLVSCGGVQDRATQVFSGSGAVCADRLTLLISLRGA